jgi:hypothetical protein
VFRNGFTLDLKNVFGSFFLLAREMVKGTLVVVAGTKHSLLTGATYKIFSNFY